MAASRFVLRVLIVDDNHDSANSLAALVSHWGHQPQTAYTSPDALERALAFRPHVIFLDIGLPTLNGITVARRLRTQEDFRNTLIAAVTGYYDEACRLLAKDAGIDFYLLKPADPDLLKRLLLAEFDKLPPHD